MIEVNNLTKEKVNEEFLKKVAKIVLKGENKKWFNVSIALVGSARIKELNKKYRKKNKATDELSFKYADDSGELAVCPKLTKDIDLSLIHGLLHLLGNNHSGAMDKKENYYNSLIK